MSPANAYRHVFEARSVSEPLQSGPPGPPTDAIGVHVAGDQADVHAVCTERVGQDAGQLSVSVCCAEDVEVYRVGAQPAATHPRDHHEGVASRTRQPAHDPA